jgi:hypothetical protein
MRSVGREAAHLQNRLLDAAQHLIEGFGKPLQFVARRGDGKARG